MQRRDSLNYVEMLHISSPVHCIPFVTLLPKLHLGLTRKRVLTCLYLVSLCGFMYVDRPCSIKQGPIRYIHILFSNAFVSMAEFSAIGKERRVPGIHVNTLDEPVSETILRDLSQVKTSNIRKV